MWVEDLLCKEIDMDVYDDVCEELAIAFCGPVVLTDEGRKVFAEALDLPISIDDWNHTITVHVDDADEKTWKRNLREAKRFFESAAGYCADSDYQKWFVTEGV